MPVDHRPLRDIWAKVISGRSDVQALSDEASLSWTWKKVLGIYSRHPGLLPALFLTRIPFLAFWFSANISPFVIKNKCKFYFLKMVVEPCYKSGSINSPPPFSLA